MLTYYALKNARIGANQYLVGDLVASSDIANGPLLVKRGLIAADGGAGSTPSNPLWDDLRTSLVRAAVTTDPPTLTVFRGATMANSFNQDATQSVMFDAQIPHTWLEGSDVHPHLHWSPGNSTSTLVVRWGLEYTWSNVNDPFPVSQTVYVNAPAAGVAYAHQIASFGALSGVGKRVSSVFSCRLFREGANAADTFPVGAFAISFDFHLQMSSDGTVNEFPGA
jgi:hypothetical protein